MQKFGIDISVYQKGMDLDKAKAEGVEFAILRGGVHLGKDSCFEDFYAQCKDKNIPVGVYLYSTATTVAEAETEAAFLIEKVLKGKQFEYPIYMDVETNAQKKVGKAGMTQVVTAFCEAIKAAGCLPGVYASLGFLNAYLEDGKLPYEKWIAQWYKECQYKAELGMWQFGGETNMLRTNKVAGIVCDQNYCYKDYPAIIQTRGLNGYAAEPGQGSAFSGTEPAADMDTARMGIYTVTAGSGLRLRTGAGEDKAVLGLLPTGAQVYCAGQYTEQWLRVETQEHLVGFCHSQYLQKVQST